MGVLADLRFSGQGLGTMLAAGVAGYVAMRFPPIGWAGQERSEVRMWAMMAGMAGGGLGGLVGAVLGNGAVAALALGSLHAMDWSMTLMGGSMGGMLGATLGAAAPVRSRSNRMPRPRILVWRLRRGA